MKKRDLVAASGIWAVVILLVSFISVNFAQEEIPKPPPPPVPTSDTELKDAPLPKLPDSEAEPEPLPVPPSTVKDGEVVFALKCSTSNYFAGIVVAVHDGDTVNVKVESVEAGSRESYPAITKVRLAGVDAPELKQPFGQEAGKMLAWMVEGRPVWVKWAEKDRYGRYVGLIYPKISEKVQFSSALGSINAQMLESGMVWHYKAYDRSIFLDDTERLAKDAGIGLWTQENPEPPWEFRRKSRESATNNAVRR